MGPVPMSNRDSIQSTLHEEDDFGLDPAEVLLSKEAPRLPRAQPLLLRCLGIVRKSGFAFILALATFSAGYYWPQNLDQQCFRHTSMYSPIVDDMDISHVETRFNNSLLHGNIYRGDASPEVDEAWHELGIHWNNMTIPRDKGLKTTIDPGSVRVQDEYGAGYMGMLEVFHQLHCLNVLRKALVYNYDYYVEQGEGPFFDGEPMIKQHVGHCLDMIRLQLMCSADVGIVPFVWVDKRQWMPKEDTKPHRLPLFNNVHRCRNFDAIRDWYWEHQNPGPFNHVQWDPRPDETMLHGYY